MAIFEKKTRRRNFFEALVSGNRPLVEAMLHDGLDPNFRFRQTSPLTWAVGSGNRSLADLLIKHGATAGGKRNRFLIWAAVRHGHHDLIDAAVDAGQNIHRHNVLAEAIGQNRIDTVQHLLLKGASVEDFKSERCDWKSLKPETIHELQALGFEIPSEALDSEA